MSEVAIKIRNWSLTLLIVILTGIIGWTVFSYATNRSVSNEDLLLEYRFQTCILSQPLEERLTPEVQAECVAYAEEALVP